MPDTNREKTPEETILKVLRHFNKKIRIDFNGVMWTGRTHGDYFIVGINLTNNKLEVNLKATDTNVCMWYYWKESYQLLNEDQFKPE